MARQGSKSKKRAGNPNNSNRRHNSWLRGQKRKEARIEAQKEREARNRLLRSQGKSTAWEVHKAAYKARRDARIEEAKKRGTYKAPVFNERGFVIEVQDGHTVLRDPDNWNRRKRERFALVSAGKAKSSMTTDEQNRG